MWPYPRRMVRKARLPLLGLGLVLLVLTAIVNGGAAIVIATQDNWAHATEHWLIVVLLAVLTGELLVVTAKGGRLWVSSIMADTFSAMQR